VTTDSSTTVSAGIVLSQSPAASSTVASGSAVAIVVSSGPVGGQGQPVASPWQTQDVGTVGLTGSATFYPGTNTYAVAGAGADIWGTADAFRFVYQPLTGGGQIMARVASVQNTNAWVKAGVMIRADLTPGSPQAMMMVTPGKSNNFQRRAAASGMSTSTAGAAVKAPYWVKLTRSGTSVTAYESADGVTWSTIGTATIALPADVLVGLAVSSHSTSSMATATFEQVAVDHP
jgi:regulation of enolase protein 1 (concanavalin A-like superfamily)